MPHLLPQVPLDYQDPDLGRASVPLVKYPARPNSTSGPYQGMILLNSGGPGESGVEEVLEYGLAIQISLVGTPDRYSIVLPGRLR